MRVEYCATTIRREGGSQKRAKMALRKGLIAPWTKTSLICQKNEASSLFLAKQLAMVLPGSVSKGFG